MEEVLLERWREDCVLTTESVVRKRHTGGKKRKNTMPTIGCSSRTAKDK